MDLVIRTTRRVSFLPWMRQKQHAPVPMAEATVEPEEPAPAAADAPAPPEEPAPPASEEPAPVDPPDAPGQEKDGEGAVAGNAVEPAPAPEAPHAKPGFRVPRRYQAPLEVITDAKAMRAWSRAHRIAGRRVALVPTMGYLHDGHLSLVRAAMDRADAIVVSIYVNPAQFAAQEDFGTYPRDQDGDLAKLRALGVHAVFQPEALYAGRAPHGHDEAAAKEETKAAKEETEGTEKARGGTDEKAQLAAGGTKRDVPPHETFVTVEELQRGFCSVTRPHFFRGVATVVCKLFNICEPDVAVFGKKDYQQWRLIRRMVRDLDFEIDVVGVPLAREPDGLAMSSRNVRLTPQHRKNAVRISEAIALVKEVCELAVVNGTPKDSTHFKGLICQAIANSGGVVDYVDIVEQRTLKPVEWPLRGPIPAHVPQVILVAAKYGDVRLLDNVELFGTAD